MIGPTLSWKLSMRSCSRSASRWRPMIDGQTKVGRRMRPRTMLALAGGATLGVAAAGALWQRRGEARDRADYPAPGAFADVGGYQLHYLDEGSGAPTVVLDSGLGGNLLSWELVAPAVAE